jgi:hypothetical protein
VSGEIGCRAFIEYRSDAAEHERFLRLGSIAGRIVDTVFSTGPIVVPSCLSEALSQIELANPF